ncbi:MAG: DUF1730 domain-containing protein [Clostridia bacterium]|nr:DUF1730 domain-containing protein [Clostridia bacterium]
MLNAKIKKMFEEEKITELSLLPLSECHITSERLLTSDKEFIPRSVIMFLMPYYSVTPKNFSAYAAAEDYHYYIRELFERLDPKLQTSYPAYRFMLFSDHSPIDERHAAVRSGLGVYGKNGLLLTETYSSFQFIGELITDAEPAVFGSVELFPVRGCAECGACLAACPTGILRGEGTDCLSAVTQKKGLLTKEEEDLMLKHQTVWGCDICQTVCPYTKRAKETGSLFSAIPFFRQNLLTELNAEVLASLEGEAFRRRAFAWRGRQVVERNVSLWEKAKK